jgi:predicted esterase
MAEKDKVYKCLNPRGIEEPVDTKPLVPRLDTLEGKTIWISTQEADPVIMPALTERLKREYPNVNWREKETSTGAEELTPDEMKSADALIQGVAW